MKKQSGFTLIELLVVIAIIGLLSSIVLVSLVSSRMKARDAKRIGDVNQLAKAMELFFNSYSSYPTTTNVNTGVLGVFSGIATTCCAPVLAGVLALAALPASFLLGGAYTLAYVLGMVIPLFILSALLDKGKFTQKFFTFRKTVSYSLLGKRIRLTISNLFSGLMFLALGAFIFYLALTNNLITHASYQMSINVYLTKLIQFISRYTKVIPEPAWALIFFIAFVVITTLAIGQLLKLKIKR